MSFELGQPIRLSADIEPYDGESADSATIDVWTPSGTKVVDGAACTQESGTNTWFYVYQSSNGGEAGAYAYQISGTYGSYNGPGKTKRFTLISTDPDS